MANFYSDKYDADGQVVERFSPPGGSGADVISMDVVSAVDADRCFLTPLRQGMKITRLTAVGAAVGETGTVHVRTEDADGVETLSATLLTLTGTTAVAAERVNYKVPTNVSRADLVYDPPAGGGTGVLNASIEAW